VRNWIPRRYLTAAREAEVGRSQWIMVRENPGAQSRILGRYAYAIFDMSGGIDANLIARQDGVVGAGDPTNRPNVRWVGLGTDANPTLAETVNASEFKRWLRTGWHGYDTLSELVGGAPVPPTLTFTPSAGNPEKAGDTIVYRMLVQPQNAGYVVTAADQLQVASVVVITPIEMRRGATPVDEMRFEYPGGMVLQVGQPEEIWLEVDDPRLNHDTSRWSESPNPNGSMNGINPTATAAGYGAPGGEGRYMYCRNAPMLSPGEFGFIPADVNSPWTTIDLCTAEGAQLLSRLVATENILTAINTGPYNTFYTNATINPNTTSTNVLKAAFAGLTRREVPNAPDLPLNILSGEDAELLAGSMIHESRTKKIVATGGAFMYGSDWVRVPAMEQGGALATWG
jgi:hypothetical protein